MSNIVVRRIRDDELYHYGVKGQKWGVRRYQNPDGTLTAEGQRKYGTVDNFNKAQAKKKKVKKAALTTAATVAASVATYLAVDKLTSGKARQRIGIGKKFMDTNNNMYTKRLEDIKIAKTYSKGRVNAWQAQNAVKNKASAFKNAAKSAASGVKSKVKEAAYMANSKNHDVYDSEEKIRRFREMYGNSGRDGRNAYALRVVRRR